MNDDLELVRYAEVLRRARGVRPDDRIPDIGCGGGSTTPGGAQVPANY